MNNEPIISHVVGLLPGVRVPITSANADVAYGALHRMQEMIERFLDGHSLVADDGGTRLAELVVRLQVRLDEADNVATENMVRFVNGAVIGAGSTAEKNMSPFDIADNYIESEMPR